jgi:hypothetical protein
MVASTSRGGGDARLKASVMQPLESVLDGEALASVSASEGLTIDWQLWLWLWCCNGGG